MTDYFKFVPKRRVDDLVAGKIYVSSLAYFRYLEAYSGDSRIGDLYEGESVALLPDFTSEYGNTSASDEELGVLGLNREALKSIGKLSFRGNRTGARLGHALVFCFSEGPFDSAAEVFSKPGSGHAGYGAAVRISDGQQLKERIWETGRIPELDGRRVSEMFATIEARAIKYTWRETRAGFEPNVPADGFHKRPIYADQQEFRILLAAQSELIPDWLTIVIERPSDIFSLYRDDLREDDSFPLAQPSIAILAREILDWSLEHPRPSDDWDRIMAKRRYSSDREPDYSQWDRSRQEKEAWAEHFNQTFWVPLIGVVWRARRARVETNLDWHYEAEDAYRATKPMPDIGRLLEELSRLSSLLS